VQHPDGWSRLDRQEAFAAAQAGCEARKTRAVLRDADAATPLAAGLLVQRLQFWRLGQRPTPHLLLARVTAGLHPGAAPARTHPPLPMSQEQARPPAQQPPRRLR
jgi:hypothetical protein